MLKEKELEKIKESLPDGSVQKIADELGIHRNTVSNTLNKTAMYRKDIIEVALRLIGEHHSDIESQKEKIKAL